MIFNPKQIVDIYHWTFVTPLFIFLLLIAVPLTFIYGKPFDKVATVILFLIWAGLVIYDFKEQRMDQKKWLENKGITLPIKM